MSGPLERTLEDALADGSVTSALLFGPGDWTPGEMSAARQAWEAGLAAGASLAAAPVPGEAPEQPEGARDASAGACEGCEVCDLASELADERVRAATLGAAITRIAMMPASERNPDGEEQAAYAMQVVARDALAAVASPAPEPAPPEGALTGAPDGEAALSDEKCVCGHTRYWHSHLGHGDCEYNASCKCEAFAC